MNGCAMLNLLVVLVLKNNMAEKYIDIPYIATRTIKYNNLSAAMSNGWDHVSTYTEHSILRCVVSTPSVFKAEASQSHRLIQYDWTVGKQSDRTKHEVILVPMLNAVPVLHPFTVDQDDDTIGIVVDAAVNAPIVYVLDEDSMIMAKLATSGIDDSRYGVYYQRIDK